MLIGALVAALVVYESRRNAQPWELIAELAATVVVVAAARRGPWLSLTVAVGSSLTMMFSFGGRVPVWPVLLMVPFAYLAGRRMESARPALVTFLGVGCVGVPLSLAIGRYGMADWGAAIGVMLFAAVLPWQLGRYMRTRDDLVRSGWQRAEELELRQRIVAEEARLRERARIASDMHDSLGHELSLIALRAAALEMSGNAEAKALRENAAAATERLREIIGLLREDAPPVDPLHGGITALVDRARASGLNISFDDHPADAGVPAAQRQPADPPPPTADSAPPAAGPVPPGVGPVPLAAGPVPGVVGSVPPGADSAPEAVGSAPLAAGSASLAAGLPPQAAGSAPQAVGSAPLGAGPAPLAAGPVPGVVGSASEAAGPVPLPAGPAPQAVGSVPQGAGPTPLAAGSIPQGVSPTPLAAGSAPQGTGLPPHVAGSAPHGVGPAPLARGSAPQGARLPSQVAGSAPHGVSPTPLAGDSAPQSARLTPQTALAAGPAPPTAGAAPEAVGSVPQGVGPTPLVAGSAPRGASLPPLAADPDPVAAGPTRLAAGSPPQAASSASLAAGSAPLAAGSAPEGTGSAPQAVGPPPQTADSTPVVVHHGGVPALIDGTRASELSSTFDAYSMTAEEPGSAPPSALVDRARASGLNFSLQNDATPAGETESALRSAGSTPSTAPSPAQAPVSGPVSASGLTPTFEDQPTTAGEATAASRAAGSTPNPAPASNPPPRFPATPAQSPNSPAAPKPEHSPASHTVENRASSTAPDPETPVVQAPAEAPTAEPGKGTARETTQSQGIPPTRAHALPPAQLPPSDTQPGATGDNAQPPMVERAAYRVVQEALTNVTKHAPGARVTVTIHRAAQETVVRVCNGPPPAGPLPGIVSGRRGLEGLRERVRLLGGTLRAGPKDGGFEVVARLPHASAPAPVQPVQSESARQHVQARREVRRRLLAALIVPPSIMAGLLGVVGIVYQYQWQTSVLDPADYAQLRPGQTRAEIAPVLPQRQRGQHVTVPEPPGLACEYYGTGRSIVQLRLDAYRLCFAGDRLVSKELLTDEREERPT